MAPLVTGFAKILSRNFSFNRRRGRKLTPSGGGGGAPAPITSMVVVVSGGGGSNKANPTGTAGGGGAGGLIEESFEFLVGTNYTVFVGGGGGDGGTRGFPSFIKNGPPTSPVALQSLGGGNGGGRNPRGSIETGKPGGSGGAGAFPAAGGSGIAGQGNPGTPNAGPGGSKNPGGGFDATNYYPGSLTLATGGIGGISRPPGSSGLPAPANSGNGAGGGRSSIFGGSGGSGRVIIKYASPTALATGGTITSIDIGGTTYQLHDFIGSGTFTIN